ncbi:MAG: peptide chain release factor H [Myxococcota bacterium]
MRRLVQITAGRGPLECAWVVERVLRELVREARSKALSVQIVESVPGPGHSGFRSILCCIDGRDTQRFLSQWQGTIQWVGRSPFRPEARRRNWYVGVKSFDSTPRIEGGPVRFSAIRASGPGGQHVNKTASAVRAVDEVTGASVRVQSSSSQRRNREIAEDMLRAELDRLNQESKSQAQASRWQGHNDVERGAPIRVYRGPRFKRMC